MIKITLRSILLFVSITCIGFGWFAETVSVAIAGAIVYLISIISSLVELIINSKRYRDGKSVYCAYKKYNTLTVLIEYILLGCSAFYLLSDNELFRIPASIIFYSQLSLFVVVGPTIEIYAGIPMQMTFGGWKYRGKFRVKK